MNFKVAYHFYGYYYYYYFTEWNLHRTPTYKIDKERAPLKFQQLGPLVLCGSFWGNPERTWWYHKKQSGSFVYRAKHYVFCSLLIWSIYWILGVSSMLLFRDLNVWTWNVFFSHFSGSENWSKTFKSLSQKNQKTKNPPQSSKDQVKEVRQVCKAKGGKKNRSIQECTTL